jgi:hypothetical protein
VVETPPWKQAGHDILSRWQLREALTSIENGIDS